AGYDQYSDARGRATRTIVATTSSGRTTKGSRRYRTKPRRRPAGAVGRDQKAPLIFARSILIPAGVAMRTFFPTTATSPPQSRTALFSSAVIRLRARSSLARLV